ncbi:MAG: WYL domain-containing protein [Limnoraphis sp. WC205]|nr:WYL domain-containing protein [Limnoraphis sp. WC205]
MSRKGQSITLSLSEREKTELEVLALDLGMTWGERPNISKLVKAIARRQLLIAPNNNWSDARIEVLERVRNYLIDGGKMEEAIAIAHLLQERSELSIPLRGKIEEFLDNPPPAWRLEINRLIKRQQPFQLFYQDATGRPWEFTVRYAEFATHEEREYLDCWCEETAGNLDIEPLQHNWSLRLDRIPEAAVIPIKQQWVSGLDRVPVEIHLFNRLAFAYQIKTNEDEIVEWLTDQPRVKRIIRSIYNTYWFGREVLQNAPDIVVISPQNIRQRLREKLLLACEKFD